MLLIRKIRQRLLISVGKVLPNKSVFSWEVGHDGRKG